MAESSGSKHNRVGGAQGNTVPTAASAKSPQPPAAGRATVFEIDFDPEGWMSERPTYWLDQPEAEPPTRLAWLRHRLRDAAAALGAPVPDPWAQPRRPEEEWIRLSEQALGPLPRPEPTKKRKAARKARPAAPPDARETAREPAAHSPDTPLPRAARAIS